MKPLRSARQIGRHSLAYHFAEAAQGGDVRRAIDYATRAAERATALMAHEDAAEQFERALQVLELEEQPDQGQRCELLLGLGDAQMKAGDAVNGRQTFERAAESARKRKSAGQLARAGLGVGERYEIGTVDEPLVEILEEALRLVLRRRKRRSSRVTCITASGKTVIAGRIMIWANNIRRACKAHDHPSLNVQSVSRSSAMTAASRDRRSGGPAGTVLLLPLIYRR